MSNSRGVAVTGPTLPESWRSRRWPDDSAERPRRARECRAQGPGIRLAFVRLISRDGRRPAMRGCPASAARSPRPGSAPHGWRRPPTRATIGMPGAGGELQATGETVTGVDRPVATRLALRDGVPVDAVRLLGGRPGGGKSGRPRSGGGGIRRRRDVRVEARGAGAGGVDGARARRRAAGDVRVEARRRRGRRGVRAGGGAGGSRPGRGRHAAGRSRGFGSGAHASALAVPAEGTVASVPVIAATMSVLRTFFKFLPFAVRAPKQTHGVGWVLSPYGIALWDVPSRSGTTGGSRSARRGLATGRGGAQAHRPQPRSHADPWIQFYYVARFSGQRTVR